MMKSLKLHIILSVIAILSLTSCSNLDIKKLNQKAIELMNAGNVDGAISRLESINDLNPNFPETNYDLGIAYEKKGNYAKAIIYLNKAVSLRKDFADAYYSMGVVYEEMALAGVDTLNKKSGPDKANQVKDIVDNFKKSQDAFSNYVNYSRNPEDINEVKSKIESLNNDIKKYEIIINSSPSQ